MSKSKKETEKLHASLVSQFTYMSSFNFLCNDISSSVLFFTCLNIHPRVKVSYFPSPSPVSFSKDLS